MHTRLKTFAYRHTVSTPLKQHSTGVNFLSTTSMVAQLLIKPVVYLKTTVWFSRVWEEIVLFF